MTIHQLLSSLVSTVRLDNNLLCCVVPCSLGQHTCIAAHALHIHSSAFQPFRALCQMNHDFQTMMAFWVSEYVIEVQICPNFRIWLHSKWWAFISPSNWDRALTHWTDPTAVALSIVSLVVLWIHEVTHWDSSAVAFQLRRQSVAKCRTHKGRKNRADIWGATKADGWLVESEWRGNLWHQTMDVSEWHRHQKHLVGTKTSSNETFWLDHHKRQKRQTRTNPLFQVHTSLWHCVCDGYGLARRQYFASGRTSCLYSNHCEHAGLPRDVQLETSCGRWNHNHNSTHPSAAVALNVGLDIQTYEHESMSSNQREVGRWVFWTYP